MGFKPKLFVPFGGRVVKRRMAFSYGCMMIKLPMMLAEEVRGYSKSIPEQFRLKTEDACNGIPNEAHITVKYGILTEDIAEVAKVVADCEPFYVELKRTTVFHNPDAAVLKLGVESYDLRAMHNRINKKLKCVSLYGGDYKPHVTIAYMQHDKKNPYYYQDFYTDKFAGRQFKTSEVSFSTASGQKNVIDFNGNVYSKQHSIAANVAESMYECLQENKK